MFVPTSFEPTTPCEPQWFPRPITDSIEVSSDPITTDFNTVHIIISTYINVSIMLTLP